jgi:four helix bundle protein
LVVLRFGTAEWFVLSGTSTMPGVRAFTDLDCWKLANELKLGVYGLIRTGDAARDFEFRDQLRNAAASAPRNIAEGFGRYRPREMSQYLRVANGSLMETANHLQDGVDRGYFRPSDITPLVTLAKRASAATTRWMRYLKTARPPEPQNPSNP